jgi:hypothetical protein
MERDDTMRKSGNQEGRRCQEAITRLASSVILAARSEASVYQGGRSHDSLGQVLVFQGHHLMSVNPDFWVTNSVSLPFLPSCLPHSLFRPTGNVGGICDDSVVQTENHVKVISSRCLTKNSSAPDLDPLSRFLVAAPSPAMTGVKIRSSYLATLSGSGCALQWRPKRPDLCFGFG